MNRVIIASIALCWFALAPVGAQEKDKKDPAPKKRKLGFTVGKDTTYVTEPLDKDGYIDYEAALNKRLSEGVTPENNANVLLFKAHGPHPDGAKIPDEFFKWMKVAAPPEKGDYLVPLSKFLKNEKDAEKVYEEQYQASARPWTAKDHPEIAEWLTANEKPLAVAIEASKRTHYYYPLLAGRKDGKSQGLITALVSGVQQSRNIANALCVRAMLRVNEKKYDEAWQDLLACHRLGRLVGRGGTLIEGLVGIALDSMASRADLAYLEHAKLDAKQLKKCMSDLQKLPSMPKMADKLNMAERFWFLEMVMIIDREGVSYLEEMAGGAAPGVAPKVFAKIAFSNLQWDSALRNSNKIYDRMHAAMSDKDRAKREKDMDEIVREIKELKANLVDTGTIVKRILTAKNVGDAKGKFVGDVMICLLVPAVSKVQQAADRTEQTERNLQVAFALAAHKLDTGNYPKALDALAPKYLAKVPSDLFTGKELIYRRTETGYLFYSVGPNGKDDGGTSRDDEPPGDDIRVRMPMTK